MQSVKLRKKYGGGGAGRGGNGKEEDWPTKRRRHGLESSVEWG